MSAADGVAGCPGACAAAMAAAPLLVGELADVGCACRCTFSVWSSCSSRAFSVLMADISAVSAIVSDRCCQLAATKDRARVMACSLAATKDDACTGSGGDASAALLSVPLLVA